VNDLHEQFANEARELIRQATDDLIALERNGPSPERIDRVFRAFHTLKGSAGVVELPTMGIVMHAAEDLLAAVRRGGLDASADIIDQALACLDLVSRWIGEFEDAGSLTPQADGDGRVIVERLQSLLPRETAPSARKSQPAASDALSPEWVSVLIIAELDALASRLATHSSVLFAISYEPIAGCFFNGDDPLQLMRQLPDMLAFRVESREAFPPVANLDPYACNLRLQAISGGGQDEIRKIFRLVPDQVRIFAIPEEALSVGAASASDAKGPLIGKVIEAQAELLRVPNRSNDFAGCVGAAARSAINALRHGNYPQLAETVESAKVLALSQRDAAPLLVALERAFLGVDGMRTPESAEEDVDGPAVGGAILRPAQRVLRVSEAKIEALVNLAGELVVAKNALAHSAKRVEQEFDERAVIDLIWRDHQVIDRLVLELHSTILQLRMVPVGQVFQSFPRLVRDVSRQLGKKVDLVTRGESTEADKTIVDRLFEPLVHLVRNAVDHGIEIPGERLAAGKSETATISIEASRIGDRVLVKVVDDGRGIDLDVVRRKVSEKRTMPPEELAALTDEQVVELIFAPGFSTTSEVSDISGRGIGMDVVRSVVEQLGGRVSLQSRAGIGTTVQIDLPTTIAMSRIMVVETAGQLFGISMDAVSETVRVTPDRIRQIKNNNGFLFRDRVVPIVALAELMKLPAPSNDSRVAKLLVVIEAAGKIAALEIEAIHDRLDVVLKPMQGLLAGARGYAGTTLLGSGQVLLVLDIKELLP
jgi:two-component system chemotaxis sensor kinase CheA